MSSIFYSLKKRNLFFFLAAVRPLSNSEGVFCLLCDPFLLSLHPSFRLSCSFSTTSILHLPPAHTHTHTHVRPAHTPDNSFMGFVSEELNETEKRSIQQNKVNNMAVVYGKEASMWKVKELDLFLLQQFKKKREKEESSVMQNTA